MTNDQHPIEIRDVVNALIQLVRQRTALQLTSRDLMVTAPATPAGYWVIMTVRCGIEQQVGEVISVATGYGPSFAGVWVLTKDEVRKLVGKVDC
jgi:hypothetical protein